MIRKSKIFTDVSKEEKWLGSMAEQGWMLVGITAFERYCFEQGEPHAWNYRVDYRTFKSQQDFADYVQLFEDSGWHHIAGTKKSGPQYFVQMRPDIDDDIFSDNADRVRRNRRRSITAFTFAAVFLGMTLASITNGSAEATLMPETWYLTPGLWEMHGTEFWRAFLFETPFALGRGLFWLLYPALAALFLWFGTRTFFAGSSPNGQNA